MFLKGFRISHGTIAARASARYFFTGHDMIHKVDVREKILFLKISTIFSDCAVPSGPELAQTSLDLVLDPPQKASEPVFTGSQCLIYQKSTTQIPNLRRQKKSAMTTVYFHPFSFPSFN